MQQSFGRGEAGLRIGTKRRWYDFKQKVRNIGEKQDLKKFARRLVLYK